MMKGFIGTGALFLLVLWLTTPVYAQEQALKLIEKQKFEKVEKKLLEDLEKNPFGVEENFIAAVLYMSAGYQNFDIQTAYDRLNISRRSFAALSDSKEIEKLAKVPINNEVFQTNLDSLGRIAFQWYEKKNEIKAYEQFIDYFTELPKQYRDQAQSNIHALAFKQAEVQHTEQAYHDFLTKYPSSVQFRDAEKRRNELAFNLAKATDDIAAYKAFIQKYPSAEQVLLATDRIENLAFQQCEASNTSKAFGTYLKDYPKSKLRAQAEDKYNALQYAEQVKHHQFEEYRNFIERYPDNTFASVAKDSIVQMGIATNDYYILDYCVKSLERNYYQKAIVPLYAYFSHMGSLDVIQKFEEEYDVTGVSAQLKRDKALLQEIEYTELSDENFIRKMAPKVPAYQRLLSLIESPIREKKWSAALAIVKSYQANFGQDPHFLALFDMLSSKYDVSIKVSKFGPAVNSSEGSEYVPVMTGDDNTLYFCARDRNDNLGMEDIYVSEKSKSGWGQSTVLYSLSEAYSNDAPVSVSTDGNTMVLFRNGELFFSDKQADGWSDAVIYPESINHATWQADGIYSSDGRAFFFSSTYEKNYGFAEEDSREGIDIYVSVKNADGTWSTPANLGPTINSPFIDRSPFLHPDMKTLYFSSNGHGGFGNLDVYKSTRLSDSCWNCWSTPINLGKEINTPESDWGYKISTNGERAIFAKSGEGGENASGSDICWLNLPPHLRPDFVATISGKIVSKDQKPISAVIRWEDLTTGKVVGETKTDPTDGGYFIVLPMGKLYGYFIDNQAYFPLSNNIDLRTQKVATEVSEDIQLVTFKQMIEEGIAVPVNNLFFNVNKSDLLPYSIPELKRVAKIIIDQNLKVELSGHTDSDGEEADNLKLSEKRAAAVKQFLISIGVPEDKIVTIGYGETKPVMDNTTAAGKAKNRRVEIRFVGN
jgi:outer membrane protein OmpA-like peptidoglycan-associated protein